MVFPLPICFIESKVIDLFRDRIGVDGAWSSHVINIGNLPQPVSLIPSTAAQEIWAIGAGGCDGTIVCGSLRGGLFLANESSSFQGQGMYDLGLNKDAWLSGTGYYGFDTVQLRYACCQFLEGGAKIYLVTRFQSQSKRSQ